MKAGASSAYAIPPGPGAEPCAPPCFQSSLAERGSYQQEEVLAQRVHGGVRPSSNGDDVIT